MWSVIGVSTVNLDYHTSRFLRLTVLPLLQMTLRDRGMGNNILDLVIHEKPQHAFSGDRGIDDPFYYDFTHSAV